jgi:3-deoxy-D-manno-octulosonic-acid transferase
MFYELVIFFGSIIARLISLSDRKIALFFSLRKGEIERIADFFSSQKKNKNKVIWFHSASAGEFEQAKPLIEHFNKSIKNSTIIASFFSPSGYEAGLKYEKIDFCFNLPLDYRKNCKSLLNHIQPYIIIFSKYDVWLNLTRAAHESGAKLALISATLPGKSKRYKLPYRLFFRRAYHLLDRIYAISDTDANRFIKMTGSGKNITVSGDTRFDRVKTVITGNVRKSEKIMQKTKGCIYLVAGSTYKISEHKLVQVIKRLIAEGRKIKLILVPHEINPDNILRVEKLIVMHGLHPVLFTKSTRPVDLKNNEVLIVDAYRVLAGLYAEADIVFIGGSFKGSVHSVLEPAIFGKPILSGLHIGNAHEALALEKIGGLTVCADSNLLYLKIRELIDNEKFRKNISKKVISFFNSNTGASKFILKDIRKIIK